MSKRRERIVFALSCLGLLALWQALSMAVDSPVLVPSLLDIVKEAWSVIRSKAFLLNLGSTLLRGAESFALIAAVSIALAVASHLYKWVSVALRPLLLLSKAVPVMSIILLAFIWFSSAAVPVFSAFLMGFPIMYTQVFSALESLDPQLEQMCLVYGITGKRRLRHFVIPSLEPYLIVGSRQALSVIWKAVIASEVLTVPGLGVGSRIQLAQVQLETSRVLAWTMAAVLLTALSDGIFEILLKRKASWR
ncbi:MAG: ABC transporter permease subunit [Sphaerochaetaceae bacterium]|jgi:NitT/TauT family transport system permease protein|nr:ABC transporter permease subunit [Sphaerochaetaceae bacterium]